MTKVFCSLVLVLFILGIPASRLSAQTTDTSAAGSKDLLVYPDSTLSWTYTYSGRFFSLFAIYMDHSPDAKDSLLYTSKSNLITKLPDTNNAADYYKLACALWEFNQLKEAETMFLRIVSSAVPKYTTTYYHASDVGDTATNIYGYGSYTSHYKNEASIYLSKIYIETNRYNEALNHLNNAVKKYQASYTCGTGYYAQREEYTYLYARCYEGLKKDRRLLSLLLPDCLDRQDEMITNAIKRLYTPQQIKSQLEKAERSLVFIIDSTYETSMNVDSTDSSPLEAKPLYSGMLTVHLFRKKVSLYCYNIEPNTRPDRDFFIRKFRDTDFYTRLVGQDAIIEEEIPEASL